MATGSVSDEWMYNEVLDEEMASEGVTGDITRRVSVDSTDLLDDVLTLPSTCPVKEDQPEDVELSFVQESENGLSVEESASARYKAEQMAKTIQARIETNKTSQSIVDNTDVLTIYSREPNKRNSIYIGNLTWWTSDMDIIQTVKDTGLGGIKALKFFENKTNGQSKGMAMIELANEALALGAPDKLQQIILHDKKVMAAYAGRMSVPQFEAKCHGKVFPDKSLIAGKLQNKLNVNTLPQSATLRAQIRPPIPTFGSNLPPFAGIRPPGLQDVTAHMPPPFPPVHLNPLARPPTLPPPLPPTGSPFGSGAYNKPHTAPHLNPAFLQDMTSQGNNVAELFAKAGVHFQHGQGVGGIHGNKTGPSDEETADTNQRNRAISSSAITRAMSDANAGDYDSAIDILKMAITLIKQSVTASSESNQMLIQSLQDCLHGIEQQAGGNMKRSKPPHERPRDNRERSGRPHRSGGSSKHHRDRSRERRR